MALEFVSGFVVSSLLQDLVDRIKDSAADKFSLAYSSDVEKKLKCLQASYAKAQGMLDGIDGWDLITSQPHRDWVADVWRACYETEDYIEHLKLEILKKIGDANFLRSFWTRFGVSCRLRDLQRNLDNLNIASDCLVTSNHKFSERMQLLATTTEPVSVPDDESFKRKQIKEDIIGFLMNAPSSSVVLISGMFGIGKTTLAQVVKNDPRIQGYFDHILWVSVSGKFDREKALCSMIIDLQEERIQEPFANKVYVRRFKDLCKGIRVLIVLDDLCSFLKPRDWEDFQSLLLDLSSIFGVIITTRNPKVVSTVAALCMYPIATHDLQIMSDEDCQSLILQRAVSMAGNNLSKRKHCGKSSPEINALKIAEKFCKGLPLVADIIGHHISSEPDVRWSILLSKDLWEMPEFRKQIFPAFRLNYPDLSMSLKQCFPYFSLFPENYNFKKDKLIQLWFAEGFIKPQVARVQYLENVGLEEHGSYYFDEVLSQSILQIYHPLDQEPKIYTMHEFIRRYAQYIASDMYVGIGEEVTGACFVVDDCSSSSMKSKLTCSIATPNRNTRHLSFLCPSIPPPIWKEVEKCHGLRTILSLNNHTQIDHISFTLFLKLQSLRVLDLSGTDITELPESAGELKHLRFLDVSETYIEELPKSTGKLYGLQFLKLDNCPMLLQLPKGLQNLTQLLYLEVDMRSLSSKPRHIGRLSNLRTLHTFVVGKRDGYRATELKNMKYLQGSICLTNLENVKDEAEAREAMLSNKLFLKRLELEWCKDSRDRSLAEAVLTGLEPHENFEELQLIGYDGARFPNCLSSPDCKLTSIHIVKCDCCTVLPALGQLQHLKALHIEEICCVKFIDNQFSKSHVGDGFPSLESLKIQDLRILEKWEGLQAAEMSLLRDLLITDCPNLTTLPALSFLTSLVKLEISSCPLLQALPQEGLPSSLETLIITRCDRLKQCCLSKQGADWKKIRTICNVVIDYERISTSACES